MVRSKWEAAGSALDGSAVNGASGAFPIRDWAKPFAGSCWNEAKAQEYQNVDNGVIGVLDVRGSSKNYYLKFFGENFGRDDQYVEARGGGYDVFKAIVYQDRMPHNLSWNAITPLWNSWSNLQQGPAGTYPPAQNPAAWNTFNDGLQRNTTGGGVEAELQVTLVCPGPTTTKSRRRARGRGSGQLVTGSGNGLIQFWYSRQRQDQERHLPGRLHRQDVEHQGRLPRQQVQQQHRPRARTNFSRAVRWTRRCCLRTTNFEKRQPTRPRASCRSKPVRASGQLEKLT